MVTSRVARGIYGIFSTVFQNFRYFRNFLYFRYSLYFRYFFKIFDIFEIFYIFHIFFKFLDIFDIFFKIFDIFEIFDIFSNSRKYIFFRKNLLDTLVLRQTIDSNTETNWTQTTVNHLIGNVTKSVKCSKSILIFLIGIPMQMQFNIQQK